MMSSCFLGHSIVFVESTNAHPLLIFLTAGELGIPPNSPLIPEEMAAIRRKEAERAVRSLGASLVVLSFPDLDLAFIPLQKIVEAVLPIIREYEADGIFSFDPFVAPKLVDHTDHNVAGQVARHVGTAADVRDFRPDSKSISKRPELYLLTKPNDDADFIVPQTKALRRKRNRYMTKYYPSQFRPEKRAEWTTFFDSTIEAYQQVR